MTLVAERSLRAGIVGGGRGAFIGGIHRIAAELDGAVSVVAGAMSSDPQTARESAASWGLARSYDSYEQMAAREAVLSDGIDFVIIATPNHLHHPVALAFLRAGIHVICDKPLAATVAEAEEIQRSVETSKRLFAITYNYSGYPLVRQAKAMVSDGKLGALRKVLVEYNQDWMSSAVELAGNKQAMWRTDPLRAGVSCCVADIGSHAEHLLEYIAGQPVVALCADLTSFVEGRLLDDDANMLLRLQSGAKGVLTCSQVACGEENNLTIRLYGTKAGLEWRQQEPNTLLFKPLGAPWQSLRAGHAYLDARAKESSRIPPGHPEGYLEAFATIYRHFASDVARVAQGGAPLVDYPTAQEGLRGMRFVQQAVESSRRGAVWVDL